jgi:hypothetical protein
MTLLQKKEKLNPLKEAETVLHRRCKILIIGESHVRGLSDKVSYDLDDTFSVIGLTKPNADIEGIASSIYTSIDNLTKRDVIIFYGGIKDIGKNESRKGLHFLNTFIQRTHMLFYLEPPIDMTYLF